MKSNPQITKVNIDPNIAFIITVQRGQTRLISIVITFIFWFFIAIMLIALHLLGLFHVDRIFLKFSTVVGILGLSPLLLTTLTWRIIEKLCASFLKSYKSSHLIKRNKTS